ncbi:MAG: PPOX class F420-dependent oxidoreductase [Chloroflexaceae bacterium]|nr:PPOX class F420-dependent oxidoreductase [Chloroflexaceae bacterium]NJO05883.1 PPOX class F420-dependent oxidoreductase [Chloroflexaceae bacterium]
MSPEAYRALMMAGTRTGKLATTCPDGRPHVVPIWFVMDGEDIIFTMAAGTVKARNIRHHPQIALSVDEEIFPYAFVLIEGTATLSTDMAEMLAWATTIARRYVGADLAEQYGRRNAVEGEILVRVTPTKVIARTGIAD